MDALLVSLARLLERTNLQVPVNDYASIWPVCETLHFVGMALLFGTIGLLDLRMLGVGKRLPIAPLEALVPWGVFGFVLNLVTGFIFVAGNPVGGPIEYLNNLSFEIKMGLVALAGINVGVFYLSDIARDARRIGPGDDAPLSAKIIAATSLLLWTGVVYFGRMIMYNDSLYVAFE
jgi:hypothetical protein